MSAGISTREFLNTTITSNEGYLLIAVGGNGSGWREEFFEWPNKIDDALEYAGRFVPETNVYFSSYLFSDRHSTKDCVLPTRTIQADLDEADPLTLPLQPTALVRTSEGRYQGYWILKDEANSLEAHEILSRKLTYSIPLCDHSGWPLGRKVRLPNTLNHKYLSGPQSIVVTQASMRVYREQDLELLPDVSIVELEQYSEAFLDSQEEPELGPFELLESVRDKIPRVIYDQYKHRQSDRSVYLWALMCSLFRAGLGRHEVFYLAKKGPNNKFEDLRFHGDRELAKDVIRAEVTVKSGDKDIRSNILELRTSKGPISERRRQIFELVRARLREEGEFLRTQQEETWYVRRSLGKPILMGVRSEGLHCLLDIEFNLNATETEHDYTLNSLAAFCNSLPVTGQLATLSYYSSEQNVVLLHTGKKEVLRISPSAIEHITDGAYGVVFPWSLGSEPFNPQLDSDEDWSEILFGNCLDNIIDMSREQAMAILKAWFMFILFKSESVARPILALLGTPGSGKSTLMRRVYSVLYGKQRSLSSVTTADNYDIAVAYDPLVALDNVDTWALWLPDRLAQAASTTDIGKRKLWTDKDIVTMKRQAMVAITAHNPRFGREDVADRLLILNFRRLDHFLPEGDIINEILRKRNYIWGAIVGDIQQVLRTPMPNVTECPQFRVEDFARMGLWIARALGFEQDFRSAIQGIVGEQKSFILTEDSILVDAIRRFTEASKHVDEYLMPSQLWYDLATVYAQDTTAFSKIYKNAVVLGKKLWVMNDALKQQFDIEWKFDHVRGARVWKLNKKSQASDIPQAFLKEV